MKNKNAEEIPHKIYLHITPSSEQKTKVVVLLTAVGIPKKSDTKKIYCPLCGSRLCDKVIDDCDDKVTVSNDYNSNFILKCRKCGQQIGIALIVSA